MSAALELGSGSDWTAGIARMLTAQRRDGERDDDRRCHSRCCRAFSFFPRGKQFDDTWHDPKGGRTSEWLEHVGTLLKTTGFPSISCDGVHFQVFGFWQEFHCPAAFFSPSQFLHLFSTSQTQLEEAMAAGPRGPVPPSHPPRLFLGLKRDGGTSPCCKACCFSVTVLNIFPGHCSLAAAAPFLHPLLS